MCPADGGLRAGGTGLSTLKFDNFFFSPLAGRCKPSAPAGPFLRPGKGKISGAEVAIRREDWYTETNFPGPEARVPGHFLKSPHGGSNG